MTLQTLSRIRHMKVTFHSFMFSFHMRILTSLLVLLSFTSISSGILNILSLIPSMEPRYRSIILAQNWIFHADSRRIFDIVYNFSSKQQTPSQRVAIISGQVNTKLVDYLLQINFIFIGVVPVCAISILSYESGAASLPTICSFPTKKLWFLYSRFHTVIYATKNTF